MNLKFIRSCTSIYPLLEGDDTESLADIDVPGVSRDIVDTLIDDISTTDMSVQQIFEMISSKTVQYALTALRVADFLGHAELIEAASRAIAYRLEGLNRYKMMVVLGLQDTVDEDTPDTIRREIMNDRTMLDVLSRRCCK